jgi:nucleoside-diphosphate-sugar epimerase
MHCLVTGAQGFLGAQVVKKLRSAGAFVTATGRRPAAGIVECDLLVESDVSRLLKSVAPDCIVHCAAHVPKNSDEYKNEYSVAASLDMLDAVLVTSNCPIVFISSMTVYGTGRDCPVVEKDAGDPASAYGVGKWKAELRLRTEGRAALAIRIPGLFGPSRRNGLVYNLLHAAKYKHSVRLPEDPVLWAAMHVNDAATGIAKLALSGFDVFEEINLAYPGKYSIDKLVTTAGGIYGHHIDYAIKQPTFEFDLTRAKMRGAVLSDGFREALVKFGNDI